MAQKPVSRSTRKTPARTTASMAKKAPSAAPRGARSTRNTGGKTSRAPRRRSNAPVFELPSISPERKLDIIGVIMALVGLLTLLSLLSTSRGSITGAWVDLLRKLAGWGTFILPAALIILGLWLVLRNIDRLPQISLERISGILLLYLNVLGWLHIFAISAKNAPPPWELADQGVGGGYLGAIVQNTLSSALGMAGAVVVLAAWLLVAVAMTLDISITDLFRALRPLVEKLRAALKRPAANREITRSSGSSVRYVTPEQPRDAGELPPGFHPLPATLGSTARAQNQRSGQPRVPQTADANPAASSPASGAPPVIAAGSSPTAATSWAIPTIEAILDPGDPVSTMGSTDRERGKVIEETLASFGAPAHIVEIHRGPTITQYGVEPDFIENRAGRTRVRVSKIVALADDLALALAASRIRIQAPVPGRNYVGIEVPNAEISRVALRDVMESEPFLKIKSSLKFALGKDVAGAPISADLATMPHLLIAGTTGSGKSVCVNSILCCLLLNNAPDALRLVLVDPKRVELTGYNGIPHLLAPVVVDAERVIGALQWMLREMDARYHRFAQAGVRNINEYNKNMPDRLPYLVVVIDELADLMMLAPDETERSITRLAQLARATGIHLILATQRPSVDVVTGLIKANFPARVAFAVASGVDSRVILDQPGAERLLGRGDMLFQAPDAPAPLRLQGVYVSDSEIQRLVDTWRIAADQVRASQPAAVPDTHTDLLPPGIPVKQTPLWDSMAVQEGDPLLPEAIDLVRREGRASISMLQRRMRIGYTRAARLIDTMEERGVIGPVVANSQVREILDYGDAAPPLEKAD